MGLTYFQAVLVSAGAKYGSVPLQLLPSLEDVREDHSVQVADMGSCQGCQRRFRRLHG
jgi:hypothetical protein